MGDPLDAALETDRLSDSLGNQVLSDFLARDQLALVVYHRDGSSVFPLRPAQTVVIGRDAPADLVIPERGLSRQHACLRTAADGVWVEDLKSTNGTFVNGVRIERAQLHLGDNVMLGPTLAALHAVGSLGADLRAIESHDRFGARLEDELVRSRTFRRSFVVMMARGADPRTRHVALWRGRIERYLRPVDHVGLYAADTLELVLPELDVDAAKALVTAVTTEDRSLACGFACYPADGVTTAELIAVSHSRTTEPTTAPTSPANGAPVVITVSPQMREVYAQADRVARANLPVLILGETGVGKELLAQRLHAHSDRSEAPLCAINCAAIPQQLVESVLFGHEKGAFTGAGERRVGLFEAAHGGAVFLDEVGELPLAVQATLLRILDTKRIRRVGSTVEIELDIRIIAATNRDLEARRDEGAFREDLLYRLNAVTLRIPPLRARRDEILPLAGAFIDSAARAMKCEPPVLQPEAASLLAAYAWPGNVRELRNAMERAVAICQEGAVTPDELPEAVRLGRTAAGPTAAKSAASVPFAEAVQQYESTLILEALKACDWNQTRAAERLGLPRRTLVHKIKAYGIQRLGYVASAR